MLHGWLIIPNYKFSTKWTVCSWKYLISCKCSSFHDISSPETKIRILKAFWIVCCHVSCLWMKKKSHSLCRHAVCNWHKGTVFAFVLEYYLFFLFVCKSSDRRGCPHSFSSGLVTHHKGDAPSVSTPFSCCNPMCCEHQLTLEQVKPHARSSHSSQ